MESRTDRMRILELIENGELSVDQGLSLLDDMDAENNLSVEGNSRPVEATVAFGTIPGAVFSEPSDLGLVSESGTKKLEGLDFDSPDDFLGNDLSDHNLSNRRLGMPSAATSWQRWWMIPLWIGVGLTVASGLLMAQIQQASGINFWFFLAGVPFILGLLLIVFSWESRSWPWLHLCVRQASGRKPARFAISFPIPTKPAARFLSFFGRHIPHLETDSLDLLLQAIGESTHPDHPIFMEFEDEEDGGRVEITIG